MAFVDGENLVLRYQDMVKDGAKPKEGVIHEQDTLVWHPEVTLFSFADYVRESFYQTIVGDTNRVDAVCEKVSSARYEFREGSTDPDAGNGTLRPRIFKKESKSAKTKSVDINLTVDALRHVADQQLDVVFLLSGDGDYLPVVEEIGRSGRQVWVGAFSKGLNKRLRFACDEFVDLDSIFFQ